MRGSFRANGMRQYCKDTHNDAIRHIARFIYSDTKKLDAIIIADFMEDDSEQREK